MLPGGIGNTVGDAELLNYLHEKDKVGQSL